MFNETSLLTLGMMARAMRVPTKWLREEAIAGRVPHLNAGGKLVFNRAAVEAALVERASGKPRDANALQKSAEEAGCVDAIA